MRLAQDLANRRRRYDHTQAFQFAHDALIAPARVLAGEPHNERPNLAIDRPSANSATTCPAPGDHPSQWAAIASIAAKLGCTTETLRRWVRQAERDAGQRAGLTTDERQRLKELERENRELKRANEILKKASAYFAQAELDRRAK